MAIGKKKRKQIKIEPIKTEVSSTDILKAVFDNNKADGNVEETIAALGAKAGLEEKKALAPVTTPDFVDEEERPMNDDGVELPSGKSEASEEEVQTTEAPTTPLNNTLTVPPTDGDAEPTTMPSTSPTTQQVTTQQVTTQQATTQQATTQPVTTPEEKKDESSKVEKKEEPSSPSTKSPEEISKAKQQLLASREKELQDILYTIDNPGAAPPKEDQKKEYVPKRASTRFRNKKRTLIFNKSLSNFSIVLIISGIILILLTVILLLVTSIKTRNGANVDMGQKIIVKNPINNYILTVEEVTNNVYLERVSKSSSGNSAEVFIRIKIRIKNRKKSVAAIRGTNQFRIYASNNQYLAECYTANDLMDFNATGAFPSSIQPKTENEGYLYCQSDIDYFPVLEITAMKEIDKAAAQKGQIVGLSSYSYYVDLSS